MTPPESPVGGAHPVSGAANPAMLARMPEPVARFYRAFFADDIPAVAAVLHPSCRVRFPSYPPLVGVDEARAYFAHQAGTFGELEFELLDVLRAGPITHVVWREEGELADGTPWRCDGVDTVEVLGGLIARVDVGGPAWPLRDVLPRFRPVPEGAPA